MWLAPALAIAIFAGEPVAAHEIPTDVVVRMLARADADRFQVLVRVPLRSMRDVEVPEFGPGYLDIEALAPQLADIAAQWITPFVTVSEDGVPLPVSPPAATQISLPSDDSFSGFATALARVRESLPANDDRLVWDQVLFDVLLEYPIRSDQSAFALRSRLNHLGATVVTSLQFTTAGGAVRAYQFSDDPGTLPLDPSWWQAVWRFVQLGFLHILDGTDHLLFLFCLVIPLRELRPLVWIVTAFTIAHSITLVASAFGLAPDTLWFPPLVETLIAISILYMALENIIGATRRRWAFAFGFGLVHGFGFSFALRETLQFAGSHMLTSLFAFNAGVELGQLFVLALLVPALVGLFRLGFPERAGAIILSALAAHAAWHWTEERGAVLSAFDWEWLLDSKTLLWTAAVIVLAAAGAVIARRTRRIKSGGRAG